MARGRTTSLTIRLTPAERLTLLAGLNGTSLGGRALTVNEAHQREGEDRPQRPQEERRPRW